MALAGDPLELRFKTSVGTAQVGDILYRGTAIAEPLFALRRPRIGCHRFDPSVSSLRLDVADGVHGVTAGNFRAKPD